jgi:hypothetical protein
MRRNTSTKICDIKQLNSLKSKVNYAQSIIKLKNIILSTIHIWSIDPNWIDNLVNDLTYRNQSIQFNLDEYHVVHICLSCFHRLNVALRLKHQNQ